MVRIVMLAIPALLFSGIAAAETTDDFFSGWSQRAGDALKSQPHWIPTLNTISPRLTQVIRYDQHWQASNDGVSTNVFDAGKGFEFIPFETMSFTVNPAPYYERGGKGASSGWSDWPFLLIKQRLASASESNGNYIATGFLSLQAPTGSAAFSNHAWVITPGIGFGKGWGDFDLQGNLLAAFPMDHSNAIGTAVTANLTAQYHLSRYFWPELELNNVTWSGGPRDGKDQLSMTVGTVVGNLPILEYYSLGIGIGYQFALSPKPAYVAPLTPLFDHNWVLSLRVVY